MCKIGFIAWEKSVPQDRRKKQLASLLTESWDLGNKDGLGFATWRLGEEPAIGRALDIKALKLPPRVGDFALTHARLATSPKVLDNTHPFEKDGAYLIHNGVVSIDKDKQEEIKAGCKSTCDSEYILVSYLKAGRNLVEGLKPLNGMSNLMLWDAKRNVLSVFPHSSSFQMWRQEGTFAIVQVASQSSGLVFAGLGSPYEYATLPEAKVYEIPIESPDPKWEDVIRQAAKSAKELKMPTWTPYERTVYVYSSEEELKKDKSRRNGAITLVRSDSDTKGKYSDSEYFGGYDRWVGRNDRPYWARDLTKEEYEILRRGGHLL
jgi:predicted glutamine amidotransferase